MKHIINETETIAYDYLEQFGFSRDQIDALIIQGKKDLYKELENLNIILDTDSTEAINHSLHALKGLFFQLGNYKVAEQLDEIKDVEESKTRLKEISKLLFDH